MRKGGPGQEPTPQHQGHRPGPLGSEATPPASHEVSTAALTEPLSPPGAPSPEAPWPPLRVAHVLSRNPPSDPECSISRNGSALHQGSSQLQTRSVSRNITSLLQRCSTSAPKIPQIQKCPILRPEILQHHPQNTPLPEVLQSVSRNSPFPEMFRP